MELGSLFRWTSLDSGGFIKIFMGMLLMALAMQYLVADSELSNPNYLYWIAYQQVVNHPGIALFLTLLFVLRRSDQRLMLPMPMQGHWLGRTFLRV